MEKQQFLYKSPSHTANLNEMRLKDKWCDVTIKVNKKEIRAHKVILAANLKYFDGMLSNDSFQESKDGVITMESIEEADLEEFVSYAYTGEILLTDNNALNLLELANYLSEDDIKEACIEFLQKHLKVEDACRAYRFSSSINSLPLKSAAKATILKNFEDCSKRIDYLELDYESLVDILSGVKLLPAKSQKMFFKGIINWIMHDAEDRKIRINDLLSSINVSILTADDLWGYLYEKMADRNDEYGILRNTMFYYQDQKSEQMDQGKALAVVGCIGSDFSYQFYNFSEEKWSCLQKLPYADGYIRHSTAVSNEKLYFISEKSEFNHLQAFNPTTKQNSKLNSSASIASILRWAAISACNRFIYLCGGAVDNFLCSNQVLQYDPIENSLVKITLMETARSLAAATFYQGFVYVLGGVRDQICSSALNLVEKYDFDEKKWTTIASMHEKRYCHAVVALNDKLYVCGGASESGIDKNSVEVYDPSTNRWQMVASMIKPRSGFSVIAHDGKLFAIGGDDENTIEIYDPSKNQWQIDSKMSSGLEITKPRAGLISLSSIKNAM